MYMYMYLNHESCKVFINIKEIFVCWFRLKIFRSWCLPKIFVFGGRVLASAMEFGWMKVTLCCNMITSINITLGNTNYSSTIPCFDHILCFIRQSVEHCGALDKFSMFYNALCWMINDYNYKITNQYWIQCNTILLIPVHCDIVFHFSLIATCDIINSNFIIR